MSIEILDTLKTIVDSTLVNVAPVVEKTIWQDKSLMTVFAVVSGIILIGAIFIFLDVRSDRKERKERENSKKEK